MVFSRKPFLVCVGSEHIVQKNCDIIVSGETQPHNPEVPSGPNCRALCRFFPDARSKIAGVQ